MWIWNGESRGLSTFVFLCIFSDRITLPLPSIPRLLPFSRPTTDAHRRMHQISDGERRRVQLCMGLMGEWDVLLLDEVTVDLDALVRAELLAFLVKESKERGATIVCESSSPWPWRAI